MSCFSTLNPPRTVSLNRPGFVGDSVQQTQAGSVPTYIYEIVGKRVGGADDDPIHTGVVNWLGDSAKTISEALENSVFGEDTGAVSEAANWLEDYLELAYENNRGPSPSLEVKKAARAVGISDSALQRARKRLRIVVTSSGSPRTSAWALKVDDEKPL